MPNQPISSCFLRLPTFASVITLVLVGAMFPACSAGKSDDASESLVIAVVPKDTANEFWSAVERGARAAGEKLGVTIRYSGPARGGDRAEQKRVVRNFLSTGLVHALAVAPIDENALVPEVRQAADEGIPVVVFDSAMADGPQISFVATDNREGGAAAARSLGQSLDGKGRVLMMRYESGSASTTKREEGFLAALAGEFPGIEVVSADQYGGATQDSAMRVSRNLLTRFESLDGIFCPNESTTRGMLRALEGVDRAGKVRLVGFDGSPMLLDALRAGKIDALVLQDPHRMGELAVETLVAHLRGKKVEAKIDTGLGVATRDTLDDPNIRRLLAPIGK